jgi:hypothetical protein
LARSEAGIDHQTIRPLDRVTDFGGCGPFRTLQLTTRLLPLRRFRWLLPRLPRPPRKSRSWCAATWSRTWTREYTLRKRAVPQHDALTRFLCSVFKKVAKVNSSAAGPFAALFCVGNFFAPPNSTTSSAEAETASVAALAPYKSGEKKVPLPTYFVAGADALGGESILATVHKGGASKGTLWLMRKCLQLPNLSASPLLDSSSCAGLALPRPFGCGSCQWTERRLFVRLV